MCNVSSYKICIADFILQLFKIKQFLFTIKWYIDSRPKWFNFRKLKSNSAIKIYRNQNCIFSKTDILKIFKLFEILYMNNNKRKQNPGEKKTNIHWKQWNKQWIAFRFPGLMPGISKFHETKWEKKKIQNPMWREPIILEKIISSIQFHWHKKSLVLGLFQVTIFWPSIIVHSKCQCRQMSSTFN